MLPAPDDQSEAPMTALLDYLLANPILLIPLLLLVATLVFAILKKLLKVAAIVLIAGAMYTFLMEYMSGGI